MAASNETYESPLTWARRWREVTDRGDWLTAAVWAAACGLLIVAFHAGVRALSVPPLYLTPFFLPAGVACAFACACRNRACGVGTLAGIIIATSGYLLVRPAEWDRSAAHISKMLLEAGIVAGVFSWLSGQDRYIRTVRGMVIFLTCAVPAACIAGVAITFIIIMAMHEPAVSLGGAMQASLDIVRADFVGILVVVPWLLWLLAGAPTTPNHGRRRAEAALLLFLVAITSIFLFSRQWSGTGLALLVAFSPVPILLISAGRIGPANAAANLTIISICLTFASLRNHGPLVTLLNDRTQLMIGLQAYIAILAISSLSLGAVSIASRRTTQLLVKSEVRYREYLRLASEGVWRAELRKAVPTGLPPDVQVAMILEHGYLAECNDSMAQMYGAQKGAELVGMPVRQLLVPSDPRNVAYLRALIENNYTLVDVESFEKDLNGNDVCFSNSLVGIVENGFLIRAWGTQRDISARRAAQRSLEVSEQRLRTLIESAPHVAVECYARDGTILFWSKGAEKLFELSAAQALGSPISIIGMSEQSTASFFNTLQRIDQSGEVVGPVEWEFVTAAGEAKTCLGSLFAMSGPDGSRQYVCVDCDVTSRVRAEHHRQRAEEQLFNAQKLESLGVMAGGVAHDFNNLLVGILGKAALAASQLPADHAAAIPLRQVQATAQRAAELTKQLLAYSGKSRVEIQQLDIPLLISGIAALLPTIAREAVVPALEFEAGLPRIEADKIQIEQVLLNLMINAAEACEGSGKTAVHVAARSLKVLPEAPPSGFIPGPPPPGAYVAIIVSDSGGGIDPASIERLFEPFFTTKFTGRGLGLAVVLGVVRAHNGFIRVQSTVNRGTTFTVLLPALAGTTSRSGLAPVGTDLLGAGTKETRLDTGFAHSGLIAPTASATIEGKNVNTMAFQKGQQGKVLVVDDEPLVLDVLRRTLEALGWETLGAPGGEEALEVLRTDPAVSMMVIDVTMPRIRGSDLAKQVRGLWPSMTILLSSGYASESLGNLAAMGVDGFVTKPFTPESLLDSLLAALSGREVQSKTH